MLDPELHTKILNRTLSRGGDYADIFIEYRKQTSIVIEDGKLEKIITGSENGAGVRLIYNGKTAYAFSNNLTVEALFQAADEASKAASGTSSVSSIDLKIKKPVTDFIIAKPPDEIPIERKIAIVQAADRSARNLDKRIKQVTAVYRDSVQKVQICTSEGFITEDERIYTTAVVQAIAVQDEIIQTGTEIIGGLLGFELFEDHPVEKISFKAAERAVRMLAAQKAPGGRMPVVIASASGGTMIHEAIGHGLEADLAQQGLSVFSRKLGSQVASNLITVIDDSTLSQRRGSFRFDDEGTLSEKTVLVERGLLKNYMYDRLTALKDHSRSTGNGRRESYQHRPIPRMSNTFIAEGKTSPEQIIRSLENGLLVEKMGGGQVNTVTGDFVFEVQEGYRIEKGKKGEPVRGATLTGNGPTILNSIDMVGNDLGFSIGTCGKDSQGVPVSDAMPTIRIPEIVVGGAYAS
jgi:TldD protein